MIKKSTMRAVLLTGYGGYDQLQHRTDVPRPLPAPGEVLIQVGACGVNNTDVWTREGAYGASEQSGWQGSAFSFPRIQGADIVGSIVGRVLERIDPNRSSIRQSRRQESDLGGLLDGDP